jgi:hypothetical protein
MDSRFLFRMLVLAMLVECRCSYGITESITVVLV